MNLDGRTLKVGNTVFDLVYGAGTVSADEPAQTQVTFGAGIKQWYTGNGISRARQRKTLFNSEPFMSTPVGNTDRDTAMRVLLGNIENQVNRFGAI